MKKIFRAGLSFCLIAFSWAFAQMPSIDDFIPPVQNNPETGQVAPTEVEDPASVKVTREPLMENGDRLPVVQAKSTQDAIIAAEQKLIDLKQDVSVIKVGSGIGYVARGVAEYSEFQNRNATLLSKKNAYNSAYLKAKANLAKTLYGLSNRSKQAMTESLDAYDDNNESLANTFIENAESIDQQVEGMIRGYATYSVNDDMKEKVVSVTIVTTPKTRGETIRVSGGIIRARTFTDGMKQVYSELSAKLVPPGGGRVITVPSEQGDQLYFVSYGASIIRDNRNESVRRKLRLQALRAAEMRAEANMCSIIIGDKILWESGLDEKSIEANKQFEQMVDPTSGPVDFKVNPLEQDLDLYVNRMKSSDWYSSAQSGKLPPGVSRTKWVSDDGDWAFAACIYNPEITAQAEVVQDTMKNGPSILDKGNQVASPTATNNNNSRSALPKANQPVNRGPSGKMSDDDDF